MSWESAAILAAIVLMALWQFGAIGWLWRRFVVRPITTNRWNPSPTRPPMPQSLRQHIFHRDGYACRVPKGMLGRPCGRTAGNGDVLEPHHWLPWTYFKGLFYATWNLVTACQQCNRSLGAKVPRFARNWDEPDAPRIGIAWRFKGKVEQPDRMFVKRAV